MSIPVQLLAALVAAVAAVALPQVCHLLGGATGLGTAIGEVLLPMHLPVLLCGFLAGPLAGVAAGIAAPLVSFGLTGMPLVAMLPVMVAELAVYGLVAGMLKDIRLPAVVRVLIAGVAGRIVRAAVVVAVVGLGLSPLSLTAAYQNILTGLPGIALQLVLIPLCLWGLKRVRR
ncbi:MAG: ECF transporter S component [Clostridia bacterium]|nr:ECF transporter S component [Clostridia bacterium]